MLDKMSSLTGRLQEELSPDLGQAVPEVFNPNANDLNDTYSPTPAELSAGNVFLTLTSDDPAGICGQESDIIEIQFSTSAIVSAGADEVICEGDDIVLNGSVGGSAVSATWSGSTGVFFSRNMALNPTFTPSFR